MRPSSPVLVTGSSGRLGRELVFLLRAHGYSVVGVDTAPAPTTNRLLDVRDAEAVLAATRGVGAILHAAALHGKHFDLQYPRLDFVRTNIEGTLHLLNACVAHGIPKFLYTSTTSIYGQAMVHPDQAVWVDEDLVPPAARYLRHHQTSGRGPVPGFLREGGRAGHRTTGVALLAGARKPGGQPPPLPRAGRARQGPGAFTGPRTRLCHV